MGKYEFLDTDPKRNFNINRLFAKETNNLTYQCYFKCITYITILSPAETVSFLGSIGSFGRGETFKTEDNIVLQVWALSMRASFFLLLELERINQLFHNL